MKKYIDLGGIIAGAVAIVLGVASMAGAFSSRVLDGFSNHLISYSFGADFYTEMYKASYEINDSLATVANTVAEGSNAISGAVSAGCGIVAIAIGLLMVFFFASSYVAAAAKKESDSGSDAQVDADGSDAEAAYRIVEADSVIDMRAASEASPDESVINGALVAEGGCEPEIATGIQDGALDNAHDVAKAYQVDSPTPRPE